MEEPKLKPKDDNVAEHLRSIHLDEDIKLYYENLIYGYKELIVELSKPLWKESNARSIYMLHGKKELVEKLQEAAKSLCTKEKEKLKPESEV